MNKRGVALILAYTVIMVLTILASAFLGRIISENDLSRRNISSSQAFWIAEAGLAQAYFNWSNNVAMPIGAPQAFGSGSYTVVANIPQVTVTGTCNNISRTIHASFIRDRKSVV